MQARIYVLGFVQGVGFRQFIKKNARSLGLKGFVRNLPDGRVEIVAKSAKEQIEKLIDLCEKGPFFSEVKSVGVNFEEEEEFEGFEILR